MNNLSNLSSLGFTKGKAPSTAVTFDSDYQAVLDRGTTLGYTLPSSGCQTIQNQLVLDLKSAGIWSKLDVLWSPANDGSSQFATLNWKSPTTHQMTLVNSPTWTTKKGFKGDGSSSYVNTNFNASTSGVQYTQTDAGIVVWVTTQATTGSRMLGTTVNANIRFFCANSTAHRINSSTNLADSISFGGANMLALYRLDSTNVVASVNGTLTSTTANNSAITNGQILLGQSLSFYSDTEFGIFGMGASLVTEDASMNTAFTTYMTAMAAL